MIDHLIYAGCNSQLLEKCRHMAARVLLPAGVQRAGRLSGALLALAALAEPAHARPNCHSAPKLGVDWSGCSKARVMRA